MTGWNTLHRKPLKAPAAKPQAASTPTWCANNQLRDADAILRSHPAYAAPRARSKAVLSLLRSGRFPLASTESATE
jgi:hypothetical protein